MTIRIKTLIDSAGEGRFTVIMGNNEPMAASEGYSGGEAAAAEQAVVLVNRIRNEEVVLERPDGTSDPIENPPVGE